MASGRTIRGSRVGSGPSGEPHRGRAAATVNVRFFCGQGHMTEPSFAAEADIPAQWECPRCGFPAGTDSKNPPAAPKHEPFKSHLAYVKERRSDADGEALLEEALASLRARRRA